MRTEKCIICGTVQGKKHHGDSLGELYCENCYHKKRYDETHPIPKDVRCERCGKSLTAKRIGSKRPLWVTVEKGKYRCWSCKTIVSNQKAEFTFKRRFNISQGLKRHYTSFPNTRHVRSIGEKIRATKQHKDWRNSVLERDGYQCQYEHLEGECLGGLDAHHTPIKFDKILRENNVTNLQRALKCGKLFEVENGKCVCSYHHRILHKV